MQETFRKHSGKFKILRNVSHFWNYVLRISKHFFYWDNNDSLPEIEGKPENDGFFNLENLQ